ncbi:hypothetical protein BG011_003073 [Mortierella polycephala]|uniref:Uncharacterized protein n=1 Tax=Mortierella polycephala TaxID=41804 RepID=A0A9P6Q1X4_9FUNG|nr:hypothetical protein BG011_003073 [Mortierella polycephala]
MPLLPSELRKRHESMKLLAKQQIHHQQQELDDSANETNGHDQDGEGPVLLGKDTILSTKSSPDPLYDLIAFQDNNNESQNAVDHSQLPESTSPSSYHSSGWLVRAKSFSTFESNSEAFQSPNHRQRYTQQCMQHHPLSSPFIMHQSIGLPEIVISTQDWVQMQTRINSLELEISHVTRTNRLLNQELDKVYGHLERLTNEEGDGWKREYEFLVQQVDMMHRQLQLAHSQARHGQRQIQQGRAGGEQPEITRQLHAEVKDLAASLKKWQTAFQQADEKYRRKCDGERTLKQTLRERESQLSSLVGKLSGYENEFQQSMTNYEELMRLSLELVALEDKKKLIGDDASTSISASSSSSLSNRASSAPAKAASFDTIPANNADQIHTQMPGLFPEMGASPPVPANVDHLAVSILSWAALLATYILS